MRKKTTAAGVALTALALPVTAAQAHVSLHPNALPQGSFITTSFRVPNEETKANITAVRVQLPSGILSAQAAPPPGWSFKAKTEQLAKPIKTDDGTVTTQVTELDFAGGKTPPGEFVAFPVTMNVPDSAKAGDVLTFKTLQKYSDGQTVRWIEASAEADHPAPTVDITAAGGPILDVTGGDAGPPPKLPAALAGGGDTTSSAAAAATQAPVRTVVRTEHDKGLAIAALIIGALGFLAGGVALAGRRRVAAT